MTAAATPRGGLEALLLPSQKVTAGTSRPTERFSGRWFDALGLAYGRPFFAETSTNLPATAAAGARPASLWVRSAELTPSP